MTTNPTPTIPVPDPVEEPGTIGATGGPSITGEVHEAPELDDDSANGSRTLEQTLAPNPDRAADGSTHGSS